MKNLIVIAALFLMIGCAKEPTTTPIHIWSDGCFTVNVSESASVSNALATDTACFDYRSEREGSAYVNICSMEDTVWYQVGNVIGKIGPGRCKFEVVSE